MELKKNVLSDSQENNLHNKTGQPKADKNPTSHFSFLHGALKKRGEINPKTGILCFVKKLKSVPFNHFTAPACRISGLKDAHIHASKQYI